MEEKIHRSAHPGLAGNAGSAPQSCPARPEPRCPHPGDGEPGVFQCQFGDGCGRAQRQGPCEGPVRGGGLRPSPLLWGWTLGPGLGCAWEVRGGVSWAVAEGGLGVPGVLWTWAQLGHSLLSCDPGRGSCSGQAPGCGAGQQWPSHPDAPRSTCPWAPKLPGTLPPGSCRRRGQLGSPPPWWV